MFSIDELSIYFTIFSIASNIYFGRNMHKNVLFLLKIAKNLIELGVSPPCPHTPLPSAAGGSAPRPPIPIEIFLTTLLLHTQGRSQLNTAGRRGRKNFRWDQIFIIIFKV